MIAKNFSSIRAASLEHRSCVPAAAAALLFVMLVSTISVLPAATAATARSGPPLLTYDELVNFYEKEIPHEALQSKLEILLTTPFVSNEAATRGVRPLKPRSDQLGAFLRVACWNIERGIELKAIRAALGGDTAKFDL